MDVVERINKQAELLKKLGFDVHTTQAFNDMVETGFIYSCDTHIVQYPSHLHLSLWRSDKQYRYAIRIGTGGLPEEVIRALRLLGYSLNEDVLVYEGEEDAD